MFEKRSLSELFEQSHKFTLADLVNKAFVLSLTDDDHGGGRGSNQKNVDSLR